MITRFNFLQDAKEHLSALADKLGSSLPDINVTSYALSNILFL